MASGLLGGRSSGIGNQLHGPFFRPFCSVFGVDRVWSGGHFHGAVASGGGWARSISIAKGKRDRRVAWRPMPDLNESGGECGDVAHRFNGI